MLAWPKIRRLRPNEKVFPFESEPSIVMPSTLPPVCGGTWNVQDRMSRTPHGFTPNSWWWVAIEWPRTDAEQESFQAAPLDGRCPTKTAVKVRPAAGDVLDHDASKGGGGGGGPACDVPVTTAPAAVTTTVAMPAARTMRRMAPS
jgi:hypothetical protein